jgi:dTDP-4-dehydrorhamnose reductase
MPSASSTSYLIVGAGGMLGHDLQDALAGREVVALTRADLDITDSSAVARAVAGHGVILNAAAHTRVDDAESEEAQAFAVNATGAGILAAAAAAVGARLVQYSTDYVFRGDAGSPYAEDSPIDPVTAYGRTKAEGERLARTNNPDRTYVLRTAWLYGKNGPNFPSTMLKLAASRETVSVITDQIGQPTWTADLAVQTVLLLDSDAPAGIYHATNSGQASWFDFARAVFEIAGLDPARVRPTDSTQFIRPAPRPPYSVLSHERWFAIGLESMRPWRSALEAAFEAGAVGLP